MHVLSIKLGDFSQMYNLLMYSFYKILLSFNIHRLCNANGILSFIPDTGYLSLLRMSLLFSTVGERCGQL